MTAPASGTPCGVLDCKAPASTMALRGGHGEWPACDWHADNPLRAAAASIRARAGVHAPADVRDAFYGTPL